MINLLGSLVQPVTGLLDKFIEDKDQKNQLAHEISTMAERHAQELAKGQLEVKQRHNLETYLLQDGVLLLVGHVVLRWPITMCYNRF